MRSAGRGRRGSAGIPAVLVPWAASTDDHQTQNVAWLAREGAAVLLPESDLDRLGAAIDRLRSDPAARAAMSAGARKLGERHRSGALAALIDRVALTSDPS